MRIMGAIALSGFARRTAESASDFASVVRNLIMDVRDSYRPQLHYMRGPGPRWHEKHDRVPAAARKEQHEQDYALWLVPAAVALLGVAAAVALA